MLPSTWIGHREERTDRPGELEAGLEAGERPPLVRARRVALHHALEAEAAERRGQVQHAGEHDRADRAAEHGHGQPGDGGHHERRPTASTPRCRRVRSFGAIALPAIDASAAMPTTAANHDRTLILRPQPEREVEEREPDVGAQDRHRDRAELQARGRELGRLLPIDVVRRRRRREPTWWPRTARHRTGSRRTRASPAHRTALSRMPAGTTATAPVIPRSARAWSSPRRVRRGCARWTARAPTSRRGTSSATRARRTRAGTARARRCSSPSGSSAATRAPAVSWMTRRRPPATRSISGPISGAITRNGAKLMTRNSITRDRAASRSMLKNSESASATTIAASPPIIEGVGDREAAELRRRWPSVDAAPRRRSASSHGRDYGSRVRSVRPVRTCSRDPGW